MNFKIIFKVRSMLLINRSSTVLNGGVPQGSAIGHRFFESLTSLKLKCFLKLFLRGPLLLLTYMVPSMMLRRLCQEGFVLMHFMVVNGVRRRCKGLKLEAGSFWHWAKGVLREDIRNPLLFRELAGLLTFR